MFKLIDKKSFNIFEPQVFRIELASQPVRRKSKTLARKLYNEIMDKIVVVDVIEYDSLLDIALSTACRAIDAFYMAVASVISAIPISADKIMINNARKYGVEAYYIHNINDYNALVQDNQIIT